MRQPGVLLVGMNKSTVWICVPFLKQ